MKSDHQHTIHAAAIGVRAQQVALVRAGDGWALPAALVPPGEPPEQVALRALHDRSGLPANIDRLLGIYSDETGMLVVYAASMGDGEPRTELAFFAPDALPVPIAAPLHVKALAD